MTEPQDEIGAEDLPEGSDTDDEMDERYADPEEVEQMEHDSESEAEGE